MGRLAEMLTHGSGQRCSAPLSTKAQALRAQTAAREVGGTKTESCPASWRQFQFVAANPSVLSFVRLHSEPIRRRYHNQNLGARIERPDRCSGVKGSGLERRSRLLDLSNYLMAEIRNVLFERLAGEFVSE
jgi:hypothetical protein